MTDVTHVLISGSHLWGLYNFGIMRYIEAFPEFFTKIKDYGGVSFGAMTALLMSINANVKDIENLFYQIAENEELKTIEFNELLNLLDSKGIHDINKVFNICVEYCKTIKKYDDFENFTFSDISKRYGNNLHILTLCVHSGELVLFNTDLTPNQNVLECVKASCCVPIFSQPIMIDGYLYCDPCITDNTILQFFGDVPKNQILSIIHIFPSNVKQYPKNYEMNSYEYYMNIFYSFYKKRSYIAHAKYINDNTLVVNNHEDIISVNVNDNGFYFNITRESVDIAVLYGFKLMVDWMKKHYGNLV